MVIMSGTATVLQQFVSGLKSRNEDTRAKSAKDLQHYVTTELREVTAMMIIITIHCILNECCCPQELPRVISCSQLDLLHSLAQQKSIEWLIYFGIRLSQVEKKVHFKPRVKVSVTHLDSGHVYLILWYNDGDAEIETLIKSHLECFFVMDFLAWTIFKYVD